MKKCFALAWGLFALDYSVVPWNLPASAQVSYNQFGNTTYGSDGSSCARIGQFINCR